MVRLLLGLLAGKFGLQSAPPIQSLPPSEGSGYDAVEMVALEGGLELERRLYESVQSSLETTTVREGLLATFFTSGAIVAVASAAEAIAQVASGIRFFVSCTAICLITVALILMGVSFRQTLKLVRGQQVQDLTKATRFVELALQNENPTRRDVVLQLTTEYSEARERLNDFVNTRYDVLWKAMVPIGIAVVFAILAAEMAILDASRPKGILPSNKTPDVPYNEDMRRPIQYPQGGGGTTVTKGGGGSGGSVTPSTPKPSGAESSSR